MQIACTKNALNYLKKESEPLDLYSDPFYSWYAGITDIGRRHMLIVSNEATRCTFAVLGLTQEKAKHLDEIIFDGIRQTLLQEHIDPKLTDQYLNDCGSTLSYTENKDSLTACRLSKMVYEAEKRSQLYLKDQAFQPLLTRSLNRMSLPIRSMTEHTTPIDELYRTFREYYQVKKVCRYPLLTLEIRLKQTDCIRVLRLPDNLSLERFHLVLQHVFSWWEKHPHKFVTADGESLDRFFPQYQKYDAHSDSATGYCELEKRLTLGDLFPRFPKLHYVYDFDGNWVHEIRYLKSEEVTDSHLDYCLMASGMAPPEDIGGPKGYQDFLKIVKNPYDPKQQFYMDWAESHGWDNTNMKDLNLCLPVFVEG